MRGGSPALQPRRGRALEPQHVEKGNTITIYGYFNNTETAEKFMHELAQAVGAVEE